MSSPKAHPFTEYIPRLTKEALERKMALPTEAVMFSLLEDRSFRARASSACLRIYRLQKRGRKCSQPWNARRTTRDQVDCATSTLRAASKAQWRTTLSRSTSPRASLPQETILVRSVLSRSACRRNGGSVRLSEVLQRNDRDSPCAAQELGCREKWAASFSARYPAWHRSTRRSRKPFSPRMRSRIQTGVCQSFARRFRTAAAGSEQRASIFRQSHRIRVRQHAADRRRYEDLLVLSSRGRNRSVVWSGRREERHVSSPRRQRGADRGVPLCLLISGVSCLFEVSAESRSAASLQL